MTRTRTLNAGGVTLAATNNNPYSFRYGGRYGYYTDTASQTGTILCGARWYSPALSRWTLRLVAESIELR